ncbi:MAG: DNA topoisomerase III [Gammaproteobacteria bacterium]|nr:DNA topoisomerase III [Gammaproteobacteria bacterium]
MRLIIAEKPSFARTIAGALGGGSRGNGCIEGGDWIVTWAFGHMYEQAMPDEYLPDSVPATAKGSKIWRKEDLPIIPDKWLMHPRSDAKAQLNIINNLLKKATDIVNAGDPDREGQLLIDEILVEQNNRKPVFRIWLQDLTTSGVQKAYQNIKPNSDYDGLYQAALSRSRCDWTLGMNVTRAYTLDYQKAGGGGVLSVGRGQTPTLNIIVERDRQVENFIALPYFGITSTFAHANGSFNSEWVPSEDIADPEGRCIKKAIADQIKTKIDGKNGTIKMATRKKAKKAPPLPFSLSALQMIASSKWGYGAQQVLDTAQKLYEEHKLTTYPRTDCGYLAEGQHSEAGQILAAIGKVNPSLVCNADPKRKSKAFNDKKVTAHTGIIPTAKTANVSALSEAELNLYGIIARHYVAQFLPDFEYETTVIEVECESEMFLTKGQVVTVEGWRELLPSSSKESSPPVVAKGDTVRCDESKVVEKKTKAPSRFTEGTLIKAMSGIAQYVDDPKVKAVLRESAGIGTEATRANIIETLKQRNYIKTKGKQIISSDHGRMFIDAIPGRIKDPAVTAWWEQQMSEIAESNASAEEFLNKINEWMKTLISNSNLSQFEQAAKANPRKNTNSNGGTNPPTKKMVAFAKKLSEEKDVKMPRGYTKSFDITKKFIDDVLKKKNPN